MSIELDWTQLTEELEDQVRDALNERLASAEVPSFLGPVHIHEFTFGTDEPEVQLTDVCDVWPEFRDAAQGAPQGAANGTRQSTPTRTQQGTCMRLRTFRQYGNEMPMSVHTDSDSVVSDSGDVDECSSRTSETDSDYGAHEFMLSSAPGSAPPRPPPATLPSVQLHIGVHWPTTSVRVALTTELRVPYSDSQLMTLPVSLMLTGLELCAQIVLALDGDARCVYVSVLEDDNTGPAASPATHDGAVRARRKGMRILPYFAFESRVGEPTKHVLENVGKVERFAGDLVRQAIEDEQLLFPNFYTVYLP
ncbi:Mitochondrial distribution and morphology protein 12 [Malassezia sp. CBS 17886]|nr:Mitochondrial distribution and morphology protein 12 [Malassezia sp. CBS 17886]